MVYNSIKKGLAATLAAGALFYGGCQIKQSGEISFYQQIKSNPLLNNKEKSLAKRYYSLLQSDYAQDKLEDKLDPNLPNSYLYKKWVGNKPVFTRVDKTYAQSVDDLEEVTRAICLAEETLKSKKFTKEQEELIADITKEYGSFPIKTNQLFKGDKDAVMLFKVILGKDEVDLKGLLIMHKLFEGLEAIPYVMGR